MKKNEVYSGIVSSLGSNAEGVIKTGEITVFVPFSLPGEKILYRVLKVDGSKAFGKVEEIVTPADNRTRPQCKVYGKCGGCQLMHLSYSSQLDYKSGLIASCLKKIGFISADVMPTEASDKQLGYRNKLQLPIRAGEPSIKVGFFADNSHRLIELTECALHGEWCKKVIIALKNYAFRAGLSAYDEVSGKGLLRHLIVKKAGGNFIVILVINGDILPHSEFFTDELNKIFVSYSLYANINKRNNNVILGDKFQLIQGCGEIEDSLFGIKYTIGAQSFMQINDGVRDKLYSKVCELVGNTYGTVIDAYCGAGLLTALMASSCNKAIGVEIVEEAVNLARELCKRNNVNNASFICAPCENVLPEIIEKEKNNCTLVLDPPRKGLDRAVAEAIVKSRPKKIIYISCSPQTLARDLGIIGGTLRYEANELKKTGESAIKKENESIILPSGYKIDYLRGYDMFAQCKGVETLAAISLADGDCAD